VVATADAVHHALLLETGPEGRFSHLELARAGGLWTFHPEPDGTLHGNAVERDRPEVRHVSGWPFGPDDLLLVAGSPVSAAATAWRASTSVAVGAAAEPSGLILHPDGTIEPVPHIRVERLSLDRWRVGEESPILIDEAGVPVLQGGVIRPLELA
jgi:hypothetical protein